MNDADAHRPSPRLVLFSGLGADARVLGPQVAAFPGLEVPPWLDPRRDESLADYARRMAMAVGDASDPARPLYLGGLSMGGMIAVEAARHLPNVRGVLLIASAHSGRQIPAFYQPFGRAIRYAPPGLMRLLHAMVPLLIPMFGKFDVPQRAMMRSVIADVSTSFIQWACEAIVRWPGTDGVHVPVHHIHGHADHVLPHRLARPDRSVPGAGHVITITNPAEVNRFLREVLDGRVNESPDGVRANACGDPRP